MRWLLLSLFVGWVAVAPAPAQAVSLIDFIGLSWEDGGFPDSDSGDQLEFVGIVDGLTSPLTWNPADNEYTLHIDGLSSLGQQAPDADNLIVDYSGGTASVYEDPIATGTNATPGISPPNATSPVHYKDGDLYLQGQLNDFRIYYNTQFNSGAFEADIEFTGGSHIGELGATTTGYSFGGVFLFGNPEGYDLQWDGQILLDVLPVEASTWGGVKALYR